MPSQHQERRDEIVHEANPCTNTFACRLLFHEIPSPTFLLDLDGRIIDVNRAVTEKVGYSKNAFIGRYFHEGMVPEYVESTVEAFEHALQGKPQTFETEVIHRSAKRVTLQGTMIPLVSEDGRTTNIYMATEDITEMKSAREQLESFIQNTADGILIFDAKGSVLKSNKAFSEMYGYAFQFAEIIETTHPLIARQAAGDVANYYKRAFNGESFSNIETVVERADGTLCHVNLTISPIQNEYGHTTSVATIARDVTDRFEKSKPS